MGTLAYGSITIIDIGDFGELSVTPESNQPTLVIYNPDSNVYTPDWSSTPNLILTPVVYYGGQKLLDSSTRTMPTGLTVTWKRQLGSSSATTITNNTANHTITTTGRLQVNANQLNTSNALLTYIVEVAYIEPNSGVTTLTASGQISFGLIQNAQTLKMVTITGANAFLYNSSNVCQNSPIILTAITTGIDISRWQYKNGNNWLNISGATSSTLSIAESASYFSGDVLIVRALGSDNTTYDEHSIVKLRDGAPGNQVDSAVLSNEDQMVPCDKNGNPITNAFTECTTTLSIYEGNTPTYTDWNISVDQTHGVTGTWNSTTHVFTVTGISANTGYVTFTCTKTGHNTLTKTFSLVKVKAGADGSDGTSPTIYSLQCDTLVVNKAENGTLTPNAITATAYEKTGNSAQTAYDGIFKVYLNNNTSASASTASATSSYTYSLNASSPPSKVRIELYNNTGTTKYDQQTIVITSDGPGGLNFILGNYGDQIPCDVNGAVLGTANIVKNIPYAAYQGATEVYCSASVSGLSTGITSNTSTNKNIALTYASGSTLGGATQGSITITLTAKTSASGTTLGTQTFTYTWVKNTQGANAVVFQLYTPNGNVVSNNENNITVSPLLLEGSTDKTSSGTYKWYYYQNGNYNTEITSTSSSSSIYKSGNNLIIKPAAVDSYLSIKCEATYTAAGASSSSTFIAYQSIYDKTDTFQVTVVSTLGDKLINSAGVGIIYTKILRNGELYDEIKSTAVATANNAVAFNSAVTKTGVTGADPSNYCWYATSSSLTLYKKSGSSWILVNSASDPHLATYTWTGLHISDNSNASIIGYGKNKAILVNGAIVNKKTMFNVTMTTPST